MNLLLSDVIWITVFISLAGIWWHGQGIKAHALVKVKKYCDEFNLQLLDESLVLRKIWFARGKSSVMQLQRTFLFEFTSTGEHRYKGYIVLNGYRVESVETDTHHL